MLHAFQCDMHLHLTKFYICICILPLGCLSLGQRNKVHSNTKVSSTGKASERVLAESWQSQADRREREQCQPTKKITSEHFFICRGTSILKFYRDHQPVLQHGLWIYNCCDYCLFCIMQFVYGIVVFSNYNNHNALCLKWHFIKTSPLK